MLSFILWLWALDASDAACKLPKYFVIYETLTFRYAYLYEEWLSENTVVFYPFFFVAFVKLFDYLFILENFTGNLNILE